jgi:hypothetical protein
MHRKRSRTIRQIILFTRRPVESTRWLLAVAKSRFRTAVFYRPFVLRKVPAWISIVLGFGTRLAGHEERIRHVYDVTREMGGEPEVIVGLVESVWLAACRGDRKAQRCDDLVRLQGGFEKSGEKIVGGDFAAVGNNSSASTAAG